VGTPHYMAPEQAGGHSDRASHRSDVYSLGAILFACVTGRPPIAADTVMQTLVQVVHHPAPPVRSVRRDVPVDLETIIAKCLEKAPSKRYDSAEKLADELDAFLDNRPIEARPRSRAVKAWHWVEGVPLVGALTGRRVLHSSDLHRRFQAGMLLLMLLAPIFAATLIFARQQYKQAMPDKVRIAGGIDRGIYDDVAMVLGERIESSKEVQFDVVSSDGSVDNRNLLLDRGVDVAPMQFTAFTSGKLCLVAPLFHEPLYVLARVDSDIETIEDLRGRRVAIGPYGSGSRETSELVFDSLPPGEEIERLVMEWDELSTSNAEAAMICIGRGSELLRDIMTDGSWRIIPIPIAERVSLQHPALIPMTIETTEFSDGTLPSNVRTVGTTALLATRKDAPDKLVTACLESLYGSPPVCTGLISRDQASEWRASTWHKAAREFFHLDDE
ncbi:MAG: TAXI family TRAP transporter solute-binding subunit, partial [Rubripirellula sp.]